MQKKIISSCITIQLVLWKKVWIDFYAKCRVNMIEFLRQTYKCTSLMPRIPHVLVKNTVLQIKRRSVR